MILKAAAGLFLAVTLQVGGCTLGSNGTQTVVLTSSSASPSGGSTSPPASSPPATPTAMPPAVYFAAYNPTTTTPGPYATLMTSQLDNELAAANLTDVSSTYQTTNAGTIQNTGTTSPPDIATTTSFVNSSLVVGFIEGASNGFTLESRRSGTTYISTTFSATGGTWSDTNGAGQTFTPYTFATPLVAGTQYYAKWDTATTGGTTGLTLTIYTPSGTIVDQETATDTVTASQGLSGPDYVNETADTSDTAGITSIQAYSGVQTAAAVANPATPIPAVTPAPGATQGAVYMLGADFACGTTPRGSVAYPTAAPSPLNTNAAATFNGHVPLIVVLTEVPGATSSSAYTQPACPSAWLGVQYMIRFDSYADYLAQKSIIPPWVWWVQYDNEPNVSPTTAPSELPSPNGNPTNIPAQFYGQFSQLAGTGTNGAGAGTPAPQYFQSSGQWSNLTSGEKAALKSTSVAYGTYGGYGWLSLYLQSQNAGATVPGWISNWNTELSAVVPINPNVLTFVGVGQVLTGPYYGTQAQMEQVIEARPPNISGIYLNCSAVSPVPIGYAECAQALADTAGVVPASAPTAYPSLSPPPFPTGSPSTPVPSATPTPSMTPSMSPPPTQTPVAIVTSQPLHFGNNTPMVITYTPSASTFNTGDMLVYSPSYSTSSSAFTPPPGWTEVSGCSGNTNGGIGGDVYTHVVTSSDSGTYTFGATGVTSGILYDLTGATFVTGAQTDGTASSVGAVSGATVTAGALDETLAFFAVLGGSTASNVTPRVANSPFTLPIVTSASTVNSTFSMSSGASGSLTPSGSLGGPFGGSAPTPTPNPYYTGAYVECTVVAHVSTDPTPTPTTTMTPTMSPPPVSPTPTMTPGGSNAALLCVHFSANPMCNTLPSSPSVSSYSSTWSSLEFQSGFNNLGGLQMTVPTPSPGDDGWDGSEPRYEMYSGTPQVSVTINCVYTFNQCSAHSFNYTQGATVNIPTASDPEGCGNPPSPNPHGYTQCDGHLEVDDFANSREIDFWEVNFGPYTNGMTLNTGQAGFCNWGTSSSPADGTNCSNSNATLIATSLGGIDAALLQAAESSNGTLPYALAAAMLCSDHTNLYVYPAYYSDGNNGSNSAECSGNWGAHQAPPEGARFYLDMTDAQVNATPNPPYSLVILRTIDKQHYGATDIDTNSDYGGTGVQFQFNRGDYSFAAIEAASYGYTQGYSGQIRLPIYTNGINLQTQIKFCSNGTC